jgi:ubiquinone biosynthesis O-methyltransferase
LIDSKRINIKIKDKNFRKSVSLDKDTLKERYRIMYNETFLTSPPGSSANVIFQSRDIIKNKTVLDLGCGSGRFCLYAAKYAKHVTGIDYIDTAIEYAKNFAKICNVKNTEFSVGDIDTFKGKTYDVIAMTEVLQHVDNPLATLKKCNKMLTKNGHLVVSIPSFNNFRGTVWLTLQSLFNLPMSLTDTFQISAEDMELMAKKSGFKINKIIGTAWDWAWAEWGIDDLKRRVFLATTDAKLEKIANFKTMNNWLDSNLVFNKQFLNYLINKKIIKKRPSTTLLKIPKTANSKIKKYLDDGNSKVNLYYCDVPPFNRMGEGTTYILKKIK